MRWDEMEWLVFVSWPLAPDWRESDSTKKARFFIRSQGLTGNERIVALPSTPAISSLLHPKAQQSSPFESWPLIKLRVLFVSYLLVRVMQKTPSVPPYYKPPALPVLVIPRYANRDAASDPSIHAIRGQDIHAVPFRLWGSQGPYPEVPHGAPRP